MFISTHIWNCCCTQNQERHIFPVIVKHTMRCCITSRLLKYSMYRSMCTKVPVNIIWICRKKVKVNVSFRISQLLLIVEPLAPACHCMDRRIFRGLTFNNTSLDSTIISYVHFCLPQSLKQNHFAVTSQAFSVTFFV